MTQSGNGVTWLRKENKQPLAGAIWLQFPAAKSVNSNGAYMQTPQRDIVEIEDVSILESKCTD